MRHRLVAAVVLAVLASAAAAHAHSGNTSFRSTVRSITPGEGLQVEVLNYDDRLLLTNRSGEDVLIRGYQDEPYAWVRADGTVEVNERSPATYLNDDRFGEVALPDDVSETAEPRWRTVTRSGRFEWHDHRAHWMLKTRPPAVEDPGVRTKVNDWLVPIEVGGTKGQIAGTLTWVGDGDGGGPPVAAMGALGGVVLLSLGLVVVVRRRRRAAGGGGEAGEAW